MALHQAVSLCSAAAMRHSQQHYLTQPAALHECSVLRLSYAGLRRWFSRMWDSSREGEGQKAPTAIPPVPSAGASPAAKSAATVETGKNQTAPAA